MRTLILTTLAALAFTGTAEAQVEPADHQARGDIGWGCRDDATCVFMCEEHVYPSSVAACSKAVLLGQHFWGWHNFTEPWKNNIRSMINKRGRIALFAAQPGGDGRRYCAEPRSEDGSFANNAIGNDNAESFKLYHQDGRCAHFGY